MYTETPMFSTLMAQPSRTLSARGLITYSDTSTDSLTSAEIVSLVVHENAGEHLPLGGVSASTLTLRLDNRQGEWNAKDFDGAIINLEIGVGHPNYSATPLTVDGGAPDETFTSSYDGGAPGEVFTAELDGGEPDTFVDEYYWANIGTYIIEEPTAQEQETIITLKGADYLANAAGITWTDGLTYPKTVIQILTEACSQSGITLKSTTFTNSTQSIATKPVWDENTTCRDVIGYIACLGCGFARIDRDGELEIIGFERNAAGDIDDLLNSYFTYTDGILTFNSDDTVLTLAADGADLTADPDGLVAGVGNDLVVTAFYDGDRYYVYPSRYKTLTRQGAIFGPFNALSVYEFGAPNGYGATRIADDIEIEDNELNSVAVQGNPLLAYELCDTLMANMLTALSGLTFYGGSIAWQGDPTITCGDFVDVYSLNNEAIPLLVLNQTIMLDAGFSMSSGNNLNSKVKGKAKTEYMRVFTPTGRLNAAALDGDINIRAGRQLNLLAGSNLVIASGGLLNLSATNQIVFTGGSTLADMLGASGNVTYTGATAPAEPNVGDLWFDTGNYNVCKRWNGSTWTEYTQGKLSNSKMTLDATGISLLAAGTFTVASGNFMIDASGNVSMKGAVTANSGKIGGSSGFTIASAKLYSGKTTLNGTGAGVYIGTDGISLGAAGTPTFKVTAAGALNSTSGVIGGFTIGATTLSSTDVTFDSSNNKLTLKNLSLQNDTVIPGWGSIRMSEGHGFAVSADEFYVYIDDDTSTDSRRLCFALDYDWFSVVPDAYFAADVSALTFTDRP